MNEFEVVAKYGSEGLNMIQTLELIKTGKPVMTLERYNELVLAGKLDYVLRLFAPFWVNRFYVISALDEGLPKQVDFSDGMGSMIHVPVANKFRRQINGALTLVLTPDNFNLKISEDRKEAEVELLKDVVKFVMPTSSCGWYYLFDEGKPFKESSSDEKNAFCLWRQIDAFAGLCMRDGYRIDGVIGGGIIIGYNVSTMPSLGGLGVLTESVEQLNSFANFLEF